MTVNRRRSGVLKLVELMDRHQLYAVHTKLLQIGNLLGYTGKGARVLDASSCAAGEVTNMHLVDNQVVHRCLQGQVVLPVEVIEHDAGTVLVLAVPVGLLPPYIATDD